MKAWPIVGIALMQALLLAAHWFLYQTWVAFWLPLSAAQDLALRLILFLLAFTFVPAAFLGFYFASRLVTLLYWIAAVWLGFLNYFFLAACLCRLSNLALVLLRLHTDRPMIAALFYGLAVAVSLFGLINARSIRVRRISIRLAGLPASWRGRTGLLLSDLHLGIMNGPRFSRRIAALAARLQPEIVFIAGDLFDGGKYSARKLVEPLRTLDPPLGTYYSTGNHDEFGDAAHYAESLSAIGIRVLSDEMLTLDGLQIIGVAYGGSGSPIRLRDTLQSLHLERERASILLNHVPSRLPIVEQAGISLQLSGHTHGGQLFPYTWFTRRAFGNFTYGLQRFGGLQVYTSSGAGTWGPPMRVGTRSEVVLLTFE